MKFHPNLKVFAFFCLIILTFTINFSCNKDEALLYNSVLGAAHGTVEEEYGEAVKKDTVAVTEVIVQEENEFIEDDLNAKPFEIRKSVFTPIHDAHLQDQGGFDLDIVRLEEDRRVSFLMFDLSEIDSIGGIINETNLEFTISKDDGNGTISVFKGVSNDWSESKLNKTTAPKPDSLIGQLSATYEVGQTIEVPLDTALVRPGIITLVMTQVDGDDLAFASKESSTTKGPSLIVTYSVPQTSESNVIENEVPVTTESTSTQNNLISEEERADGNSTNSVEIDQKNQAESIVNHAQDEEAVGVNSDVNPSKVEASETEQLNTGADENNADGDSNELTKEETNSASGAPQNEGPLAVAEASNTSGSAPLKVSFNGSNSKDDKAVTGYFWDFKDGNTTTSKNPTHSFSDPGDYQVALSVKDEEGQTHTSTIEISVDQKLVTSSGNVGNGGSGGSEPNNGGSSGNTGISSSDNDNRTTGNYPSNAVFASSFGFKSGDATDALESALNSGNSYIVVDKQSSDWIVRPMVLFNLRNKTIVFEPGVTLRAKSGAFGQTNDQLFHLKNAQNVTIEGYGATFRMNKNEYSNGEHRHALAISSGNGVTVRGLTLRDSGGDGILIAGIGSGSYSQNITVEDVVSTNNKRLGMGIISAQNVWVRNSEFSNTSGTLPEAGVDLEPNDANERLVNINFINCKFANNASRGFFLSTGKMKSSSTPISVKVSNCEFSYNATSGGKKSVAEIELSQGITNNPVRGEIVFEGAQFNGSNNKILFSKKSAESYTAVFKNCTAKDVAKNSDSVISLEALSTVNTLGGFVFDNFDVHFNSNASFMQIGAPSSGLTVKDIKGDFTVRDPNDNPLEYKNGYSASKNVNVSINYNHL